MQTFRQSPFSRFFPMVLAAAIAIVMAASSAWVLAAIAGVVAVLVGYATNRVSLRFDDAGVHHQGWRPGVGWSASWDELTGLYVDSVRHTSSQDGGSMEHRLSFERAPQRPLEVRGYSTKACEAMLAIFEQRGLRAVFDDKQVRGG